MVLVGKPQGKGTSEDGRRRWKDNFKMNLQESKCGHRLS
jgi:hypothetical protein